MINKSNKFRLMVKRRLKCWNGFTFTGRFELAPDRVPEQMKRKLENYITNIVQNKNILVVGPVAGNEYNEMVIPPFSPDPSK
jgi:hypothetical protein